MSSEPSYGSWPLRIRIYQGHWSITFHEKSGKLLHVMNANSQIEAFRAADKLATLYHFDGEILLQSDGENQLINVRKIMHFREQ